LPAQLRKTSSSQENARRVLGASRLRFTKQRSLILEIVGQGHLDADEVYRRARQKESHLSLSTVYRSLQVLKKLGLIAELHFDESHHHYEVKPSAEHHHLVCLGCGQVIEFDYPLSRYVKARVDQAKDFDIVDAEVRMTGYCAKCRQDRK